MSFAVQKILPRKSHFMSQKFLTCWLSVLIEKAEMSNKALKINPNDMRIHIICKIKRRRKFVERSFNESKFLEGWSEKIVSSRKILDGFCRVKMALRKWRFILNFPCFSQDNLLNLFLYEKLSKLKKTKKKKSSITFF